MSGGSCTVLSDRLHRRPRLLNCDIRNFHSIYTYKKPQWRYLNLLSPSAEVSNLPYSPYVTFTYSVPCCVFHVPLQVLTLGEVIGCALDMSACPNFSFLTFVSPLLRLASASSCLVSSSLSAPLSPVPAAPHSLQPIRLSHGAGVCFAPFLTRFDSAFSLSSIETLLSYRVRCSS